MNKQEKVNAIEDAAASVVAHAMVIRALRCLHGLSSRATCRCPPCMLWKQIDKLATACAEMDTP